MSANKHAKRGSTIVEVMMALTMFAVGVTGIVAMQKVTVVANRDAKNLEIANEIARTWVERLRGDAMLWNHPSSVNPVSDLGSDTLWLQPSSIYDPGQEQWFRPTNTTRRIYGVHNALGVDDGTGSLDGPFCVNVRLMWLRKQPQGLVRAEVRVYWLRSSIQGVATQPVATPLCSDTPPSINNTQVYHAVHVVTALHQNTAN